jgi:hypothetical protein
LLCSLYGIGQGPVILRGLVGHGPFIDNTFRNTLATKIKLRREAVTIVSLLMNQSAYSISKADLIVKF